MKSIFSSMSAYQPYALALLRIIAGYNFLLHGTQKLFAMPAGTNPQPEMFSFFWVGGVLELVLGVMILIGFQTRLAAFLASGMMAVAYFTVHAAQGHALLPLMNGGETAVLYAFIYLYLWTAGSGTWSVDSLGHQAQRTH